MKSKTGQNKQKFTAEHDKTTYANETETARLPVRTMVTRTLLWDSGTF